MSDNRETSEVKRLKAHVAALEQLLEVHEQTALECPSGSNRHCASASKPKRS
jgi:hypothetical protein